MTSPRPATPVVRLRSASFGYAERVVVTGVDLTVDAGEVIAVLGPNGSGKSTIVKGILGLAQLTSGTVELFGEAADELSDRTRLGYVPQRHTLSAAIKATVEEIVAIGRVAHHPVWAPWRQYRRSERRVIRDAIDVVGLSSQRTHDVATLSGGQQRRVLIARALASSPELFLLDEPTAGVDVGNQQVLADVLARLVASGATMIIVTHELAALRDIVTRAVVVRDGEITYDGPPEALSDADHAHDHHHHDDDLAPPPSHLPRQIPTTGSTR